MDSFDVDRINTLYHKSKSVGLTPEEKEEQKRLRKAYIQSIRNNLRGSLDSIDMVNPDGTTENLGETIGKKYKKN